MVCGQSSEPSHFQQHTLSPLLDIRVNIPEMMSIGCSCGYNHSLKLV